MKLPGWEQLRGWKCRAYPFLGPRMLRWGLEDSKITPFQNGQGATCVLSDPSPTTWKPHLGACVPGRSQVMSFFGLTYSCPALSPCVGCDLPLGWYHVIVLFFCLTQPQSLLVMFVAIALPLALLTACPSPNHPGWVLPNLKNSVQRNSSEPDVVSHTCNHTQEAGVEGF